jgi:hypothetical protein
VSNVNIRAKIRTVAWDPAQIIDCSHLLVFAAWDDITDSRVNMMFDLTNDVRGFKNEGWGNYRQLLLGIGAEEERGLTIRAPRDKLTSAWALPWLLRLSKRLTLRRDGNAMLDAHAASLAVLVRKGSTRQR